MRDADSKAIGNTASSSSNSSSTSETARASSEFPRFALSEPVPARRNVTTRSLLHAAMAAAMREDEISYAERIAANFRDRDDEETLDALQRHESHSSQSQQAGAEQPSKVNITRIVRDFDFSLVSSLACTDSTAALHASARVSTEDRAPGCVARRPPASARQVQRSTGSSNRSFPFCPTSL